jgi:uncharacterized protein (DUF1778 family)
MPKPMKDDRIAFRCEAKLRSALEQAAKRHRRSLANLMTLIVLDWLETNPSDSKGKAA